LENIAGEPLHDIAVVARKLENIPEELVNQCVS